MAVTQQPILENAKCLLMVVSGLSNWIEAIFITNDFYRPEGVIHLSN